MLGICTNLNLSIIQKVLWWTKQTDFAMTSLAVLFPKNALWCLGGIGGSASKGIGGSARVFIGGVPGRVYIGGSARKGIYRWQCQEGYI